MDDVTKSSEVLLGLFFGLVIFGISTETAVSHDSQNKTAASHSNPILESKVLKRINNSYKKSVKSIFQQKCFDCHSSQTEYPWYYRFPVVRKIIDHDIREGLEHLNMSKDFPFQGHGSPAKDLVSLEHVVASDEMPPSLYRFFHWKAALGESEKKLILAWVQESRDLLDEAKNKK